MTEFVINVIASTMALLAVSILLLVPALVGATVVSYIGGPDLGVFYAWAFSVAAFITCRLTFSAVEHLIEIMK